MQTTDPMATVRLKAPANPIGTVCIVHLHASTGKFSPHDLSLLVGAVVPFSWSCISRFPRYGSKACEAVADNAAADNRRGGVHATLVAADCTTLLPLCRLHMWLGNAVRPHFREAEPAPRLSR